MENLIKIRVKSENCEKSSKLFLHKLIKVFYASFPMIQALIDHLNHKLVILLVNS